MKHIYLAGAVCATGCLLYFTGRNVGTISAREKCTREVTQITLVQTQHAIQTNEKINAEINHTGMRDIRRILHQKYTIAE